MFPPLRRKQPSASWHHSCLMKLDQTDRPKSEGGDYDWQHLSWWRHRYMLGIVWGLFPMLNMLVMIQIGVDVKGELDVWGDGCNSVYICRKGRIYRCVHQQDFLSISTVMVCCLGMQLELAWNVHCLVLRFSNENLIVVQNSGCKCLLFVIYFEKYSSPIRSCPK